MCEGPTGQRGPQVTVSRWDWQTSLRAPRASDAGRRHVCLLLELLMPRLSTSLKRSFLGAFRNPRLCGLSGLVSVGGKGASACREQGKVESCTVHDILGFLSQRSLQFSPGIRTPRGMLLLPLEAPRGTQGTNLARSSVFCTDSPKRETGRKLPGQWHDKQSRRARDSTEFNSILFLFFSYP